MMIRQGIYLMILATTLVLPVRSVLAQSYDKVYVFGDILADQGNEIIAGGFEQLPPPFYETTVKDGPLAVERLGDFLGVTVEPSRHLIGPPVGTNYAVAGASTRNDDFLSFEVQIDAFETYVGSDPDALYVIYAGAKDVDTAVFTFGSLSRAAIIDDASDGTAAGIRRLIDSGARNIIVMNLPDFGDVPKYDKEDRTLRATSMVESYNAQLDNWLDWMELTNPGLKMVRFDTFEFAKSVKRNADALGFDFLESSCLPDVKSVLMGSPPQFHPACAQGARGDEFMFFADIVYSAHFEERLARALYSLVSGPAR